MGAKYKNRSTKRIEAISKTTGQTNLWCDKIQISNFHIVKIHFFGISVII